MVNVIEGIMTVDASPELCTEEKGASELAMQGIAGVGGRGQSVLQERWEEELDAVGHVLLGKVKWSGDGEGLAKNGGSLDVRINTYLAAGGGEGEGEEEGEEECDPFI